MPAPSLSPIERAHIAEAARLASAGAPVRWQARDFRLVYLAGGKEHKVFSLSTSPRGFWDLCRQAELEYARNVQSIEEKRAAEAEAERAARAVAVAEISPVDCGSLVHHLSRLADASGAHGEQRAVEQGA